MAGEGSVYLRKSDGRWVAEWTDNHGRRRYRYRKTRAAARQALREALRARDDGASGDDPTLGVWCGWWLDQLDRRPTTIADRRYKIGLLPGWLTGRRLSELTPMDVHEALRELSAGTTVHGRPRSASTVAQVRTVLTQALRAAERYGHVTRNAAALAAPVKYQHAEPVPLSVEQARRLLDVVKGHPLESMYVVALATGMRQGELVGLRWSGVNLDAGTVVVSGQLTRTNDGTVVEGDPKTARSARSIALPRFAVDALTEHRSRRGRVVPLSGYVWATSAGTPYQPSNLRRHLSRSCELAGVPRITFHTLRHSAASMLLALGVPDLVIADLLGHADMRTLKRYAHVTDGLRTAAADAVDGAFLSDGLSTPEPRTEIRGS